MNAAKYNQPRIWDRDPAYLLRPKLFTWINTAACQASM